MKARRVVTGHDAASKSVFASDSIVEADAVPKLGFEFLKLWGADHPATFPDDGSPTACSDYFPPRGGYRFGIFTIPAAPVERMTRDERPAAYARFEELFPGLLAHMEHANPGMHTSDSIDFGYVISGSIWLELDDGSARELRAGETYVQNGTRHAWRNRSSEPCSILVTLIGVRREPPGVSVVKGSVPHTETPTTTDAREQGQGTGSAS